MSSQNTKKTKVVKKETLKIEALSKFEASDFMCSDGNVEDLGESIESECTSKINEDFIIANEEKKEQIDSKKEKTEIQMEQEILKEKEEGTEKNIENIENLGT